MNSQQVVDLATRIQRRRDFAAHVSGYFTGAATLGVIAFLKPASRPWLGLALAVWATGLSFQHFRHVIRGPVTERDIAEEAKRLHQSFARPEPA